jgi:hypothetical protein
MAMPSVDHITAGGFVFLARYPFMLTLRQILQPHAEERRAVARTLINCDVLMHFAGCNGVYACHVCDVTSHGARIRLNGLNVVPFEFGKSFDKFRSLRKCRLIWRNSDFVGVAFPT